MIISLIILITIMAFLFLLFGIFLGHLVQNSKTNLNEINSKSGFVLFLFIIATILFISNSISAMNMNYLYCENVVNSSEYNPDTNITIYNNNQICNTQIIIDEAFAWLNGGMAVISIIIMFIFIVTYSLGTGANFFKN